MSSYEISSPETFEMFLAAFTKLKDTEKEVLSRFYGIFGKEKETAKQIVAQRIEKLSKQKIHSIIKIGHENLIVLLGEGFFENL